MVKLKRLGKGLDALLSASDVNPHSIIDDGSFKLRDLELLDIKPSKYQPRSAFDENDLQELADSIKQNGVIQPIVVRKLSNYYELIAGERRWRASKIAGLSKIPAIVRVISDEEALAIALIENIQRRDLNIIEESRGYKRLIDEFNLTHEELAKITGKSRSHVTNILRLLNLADKVQELLIDGSIGMGHARALLPLRQDQQLNVAQKIVQSNMTTAEVERYVSQLIANSGIMVSKLASKPVNPDISRLETELADKIGMVVRINHDKKGSGRVIINYASLDELDSFLVYLK